MTQPTAWSVPLIGPVTPTAYSVRLDESLDALLSSHEGTTAPAYGVTGTTWLDTAISGAWAFKIKDGTDWITVFTVNSTTNTVSYDQTASDARYGRLGTAQTWTAGQTINPAAGTTGLAVNATGAGVAVFVTSADHGVQSRTTAAGRGAVVGTNYDATAVGRLGYGAYAFHGIGPGYLSAGFVTDGTLTSAGLLSQSVSGYGGRLDTQANNQPAVYLVATGASYASDLIYGVTTRAAAAGFDLMQLDANAGSDPKFRVNGLGAVTADGAYAGTGADYAEYFEWVDGNEAGEDRRALSVVLEGGKIRAATDGDTDLLGIVSTNPTVVGDAAALSWTGKYLRDDFGSLVTEDYVVAEWDEVEEIEPAQPEIEETVIDVEPVLEEQIVNVETITIEGGTARRQVIPTKQLVPAYDEIPLTDTSDQIIGTHRVPRTREVERAVIVQQAAPAVTRTVRHSYALDALPDGVTVPDHAEVVTLQRPMLNPAYDPDVPYVPREQRSEWAPIGLMGKLRLKKGQPVSPRWVKLRDISDAVEEWLVR